MSIVLENKRSLKLNNSSLVKKISFREVDKRIPTTTYASFGIYRYPAKFIPQIISALLDEYGRKGYTVLDPFGGSGTTGMVAKVYGIDYELWDINPMLKVIHQASISEPTLIDYNSLIREIGKNNIKFIPQWSNIEHWYPSKIIDVLYKVWGFFHSLENYELKKSMLIPLLKITRKFSYNDAPRQKLSRSKLSIAKADKLVNGSADCKEKFLHLLIEEMKNCSYKCSQYQNLIKGSNSQGTIRAGLNLENIDNNFLGRNSWDLLITSPPYLQAQEYIRNSKMDLFWLGYSDENIRIFSKSEMPYCKTSKTQIYSDKYYYYKNMIKENHLRKVYKNYFYGVLGALTKISNRVNDKLLLFVGSASIRGIAIPIYEIFTEHFSNIGWKHEKTYIDTIVSKVLFKAKVNPATGIKDNRIDKEQLIVLGK